MTHPKLVTEYLYFKTY